MIRINQPHIYNVFIILTFLLSGLCSYAGSELYIKNYTKQEYQAASQNWSVAQDDNGYLYFANNVGLLEFDGITWTLYPAPDGAIVRTVAVDKHNRIFTAGYRELGFWERNTLGRLEYHSLKKEVEENFTANEEFWNVISAGNYIYFQSFSKIYIYDFQKFEIVNPENFITSISDGGDRIFVNIMHKGIYQITGTKYSPYLVSDSLNQTEIRFILSLNESKKLIGTANNGILFYDGQKLSTWQPAQSDYFRENIINRGCISSDGKIIIGTILDGISVFDQSGNLLYRLNKENGLQNNTVLGVIADTNNNLWIALDKGVDFISFSSDPSYSIVERKELGAVYTAAIYRNKIYLGTNQGLYFRSFPSTTEPFQLVPETQGQVWDCKVIDDRLFINHNKGTFEISGDQVRQISPVSGGFSIIENPVKPNSLVQSTYSNLIFYKKENSSWKIDQVVYSFNELIRYLEVDHLENFWASHLYRGIFRLKFNSRDSLVYNRYYGNDVFGKDNNIHVFKVENRIVFTTGEKLYTFDDLRDTITDYKTMNQQLGNFQKATRIVAAPEHNYWLITDQSYGLFNIQNSEVRKVKEYPTGLFNNQLIIGYENIVPVTSTKAILCLENGYALLNADTLSPASLISENRPELRRITISGNNGLVEYLPLTGKEMTLHYNWNNLQLRFSFPFFSPDNIKYQSFIPGLDQHWSEAIDKPIFSFKRIPVGNYKINVRAVNTWGETSQQYSTSLVILPPWYLSPVAYLGYILVILFGLLIFSRTIITRTRQKESREREEKERELIQLRNEKLQAELSFKSSELASSTMAIIKKNEFLMDLKEILKNQKIQLSSRYPDKYYDILVGKIDDNISSQDDWKVFETNFERAHEQFMKTLIANYHDLTSSDLRLCAFLRMNLSSKEIAPLMGISFRGVENHRYRLRKKLNLDADSNLTDFIIRL
ncbi:MAG TPA: triple tyrosine motif-containing protein [Prolixibacteraceae bacterium]|nr:triple tyrosine motif-containing protein [Prolixibacteraceae bacterium]